MPTIRLFNPIQAARAVEASYRNYLATTIHFEDKDLQDQLRAILEGRNFLSKGLSWKPPRPTPRTQPSGIS